VSVGASPVGFVAEPFIIWSWIFDHTSEIWSRLIEHLELTAIAVGLGLVICIPLSVFAYRHRRAYAPITWITGLLYTIPSLALFALLVPFTGFSFTTAEIGLVSYTLLILIRNIVAGLNSVPEDAKDAALGMGYTSSQLLWQVEFPLAMPVMVAGVRIATVTTVGLVTVTALIGKGGLGHFILTGLKQSFSTEILLGAVLSVALAVVMDGLLLLAERLLTPWARARRARATPA
jgi:osmoprotectant transport system permease protein